MKTNKFPTQTCLTKQNFTNKNNKNNCNKININKQKRINKMCIRDSS